MQCDTLEVPSLTKGLLGAKLASEFDVGPGYWQVV